MTTTNCDLCRGAIKDKPIHAQVYSDNKLFNDVNEYLKNETKEYKEHGFVSLFGPGPKFQKALDLCEKCGLSLIKALVHFEKLGRMENEQFEKFFV